MSGLLLVAVPAPARAVPAVTPDSTRAIRPALAPDTLRPPDPARYAALRARADLQYPPPGYRPRLTWWGRFWTWFWDVLDTVFSSPAGRTAGQGMWYAFLLTMLTWVVLRVLKLDITSVFGRTPRAAPAYEVALAESPFTDDLAARLADAEARADHRLAVRLGYLLTLRQLADRDLIRWLPDTTNQQYLRALPAGPLPALFAPLTRQFEAAWYGEVRPTEADYAAFAALRAHLTLALQAVPAATGVAAPAPGSASVAALASASSPPITFT